METLHEEATQQECADLTKRQLWGTEVVVGDNQPDDRSEALEASPTAAEPARESMSGKEARKSETTPAKDAGTNVDEETDDAYDNEDFPDRYRLEVRNCDTDKLYYRSPPMHPSIVNEEAPDGFWIHAVPSEVPDDSEDVGFFENLMSHLKPDDIDRIRAQAAKDSMQPHEWVRWVLLNVLSKQMPPIVGLAEPEEIRVTCFAAVTPRLQTLKLFVDLDPAVAQRKAERYAKVVAENGIIDAHVFQRQAVISEVLDGETLHFQRKYERELQEGGAA